MKYITRKIEMQELVVNVEGKDYELIFNIAPDLDTIEGTLLYDYGVVVPPEGYRVISSRSRKVVYRMPVEEFIKIAEVIG